jgi:hypothetical protein
MSRKWLALALALLNCGACSQTAGRVESASFNHNLWIEDFHQIQVEMSSHYANLEWAVETRRMDLPQLRKDTEAKLSAATDEAGASRLLVDITHNGGGSDWVEAATRTLSSVPLHDERTPT